MIEFPLAHHITTEVETNAGYEATSTWEITHRQELIMGLIIRLRLHVLSGFELVRVCCALILSTLANKKSAKFGSFVVLYAKRNFLRDMRFA